MALLVADDLFIANRGAKTGRISFGNIQNTILSGNIIVSPVEPDTGREKDGSVWINTATPSPTFTVYDTAAWVPLQLSGNRVKVDDSRPTPVDQKAGDMWFAESDGALYIVTDPNGADLPLEGKDPWVRIIPPTLGQYTNVSNIADLSTDNTTIQFLEIGDTGVFEYKPVVIKKDFELNDMLDVYLDPPTRPKAGQSLGFFDDIYGDGTTIGWAPSTVGPVRLVDVVVEDPKDTGTRFEGKTFKATVTLTAFKSSVFKVIAYVDGKMSALPIDIETGTLYCNINDAPTPNEVIGLQQVPMSVRPPTPAVTTELEYELKFPDKMDTGNNTDADLPDGTSLTIEFQVTDNATGDVIIGISDPIIPAVTVTRNKLTSEIPADVAVFNTVSAAINQYPVNQKARRDELSAARVSAITKLTALGMTEAEIDSLSRLL